MNKFDYVDPRQTFGRTIAALAERNLDVVVVSADSGKSAGFGDFAVEHPDRYFEVGIAEQAATGISAGLATTGLIPVFSAIAPFVTSRNFEFFRNDVGYMKQNVKIVGRNGGFTYAELGSTHHSLEDYALTGSIPGVTVLAPSDAGELKAACAAMLSHRGPVYMRIGAEKIPDYKENREFVIGKGYHVTRGDSLTVATTGYTGIYVRRAVELLIHEGLSIDLICLPTVTPLDEEIILKSAERTRKVLTIEEHYEFGGLGSRVAQVIARAGTANWEGLSVPQVNQPSSPYHHLLAQNSLDVDGICRRIRAAIVSA